MASGRETLPPPGDSPRSSPGRARRRREGLAARSAQAEPALGLSEPAEAVRSVQAVRVSGGEEDIAGGEHVGMGEDRLHEPPPEAAPAVRGKDEDVGDPREGG